MPISLVHYLDASAEKFPHKLAISDEKLELTFSQLKEAAEKVASHILHLTDKKNQPIAVEVDRCTQSIVLFLGVLYSGNFYVPMDAKMPEDRAQKILQNVDPFLCLGLKDKGLFSFWQGKVASYEEVLASPIDSEKVNRAKSKTIDMDPCYMIYTSGSTGLPKGVVISHRMVMDFSNFLSQSFDISSEDVIANQAPFYFDCSVKGIYQMLRNGCTLYILRPMYFMFPIKAIEFFNEKKVTTLLWATSGLNILSNSGVLDKVRPKTLRKIFFSGEALYGKNYLPWKESTHPDTRFINLYGPTEVTVDCCYYEIKRDFQPEDVIPIGSACPNMEVFLLNEENGLAKPGDLGEICARGTGISYGYYKDPEKTSQVFVQNPLNPFYRDIIYKTGDLGRYNDKGEILYISRKDNQVKHQGNRIELGEIEAASNGIDGVKESVVFYDHDNKQIILTYTGSLDRASLVKEIKTKVPKYMLPAELRQYKEFPHNRNGKIDRVQLKVDYFDQKS